MSCSLPIMKSPLAAFAVKPDNAPGSGCGKAEDGCEEECIRRESQGQGSKAGREKAHCEKDCKQESAREEGDGEEDGAPKDCCESEEALGLVHQ